MTTHSGWKTNDYGKILCNVSTRIRRRGSYTYKWKTSCRYILEDQDLELGDCQKDEGRKLEGENKEEKEKNKKKINVMELYYL
jgi:hypothetical protein